MVTTLSWLLASDVANQTPLIDLLIASKSAAEADQVLLIGKPLNGGGPLNSIKSTYTGLGFRVERTVFPPTFEFSAWEVVLEGPQAGSELDRSMLWRQSRMELPPEWMSLEVFPELAGLLELPSTRGEQL